ncbi:predicted protein [Histoplasma capsulatum G186AR]|uniref:Uncharacterized protein n=1 Tax=Ajellomyces capsulatus (strain G186AR / H82 / ATCC MYA-2454 / RMSCC 2432) TaxID=447093 RepID=C0NBJ5_AJECG|nr:uncharacterized protein HCBG_00491 [Histoplasma capsulatum G186AR]EEH11036.1 predicted protein [Histoplasma capsulatum G186AR]
MIKGAVPEKPLSNIGLFKGPPCFVPAAGFNAPKSIFLRFNLVCASRGLCSTILGQTFNIWHTKSEKYVSKVDPQRRARYPRLKAYNKYKPACMFQKARKENVHVRYQKFIFASQKTEYAQQNPVDIPSIVMYRLESFNEKGRVDHRSRK